MARKRRKISHKAARERNEGAARKRKTPSRKLGFEPLEARRLLALTDLASITGQVFVDATGNGFTSGEQVSGATLNLYRDTNSNGILDGTDTPVGASATTDASGNYRFDRLSAGSYIVQQPAQNAGGKTLSEQISSAIQIGSNDAQGTPGTPIDTFTTVQSVIGPFPLGVPQNSSVTANEAIGGERDLIGELTAGRASSDELELKTGSGQLAINAGLPDTGVYRVVWDGPDGQGAVLNATGLGGFDLTANGVNQFILLSIGVDKADGTATLNVYSDQNNWSKAEWSLVDSPSQDYALDLSNGFITQAGSGANMSNVGAIELVVTANRPAMDGLVTAVETRGPTEFTSDFDNYSPADLRLAMTADTNSPQVNGIVTFTLTVTNDGPATATGVALTDRLPTGLTFQSATPSQGLYTDSTGVWEVGSIASGGSATLQLIANVTQATTILNTAEVTASGQVDPDSTPNNGVTTEDDYASLTLTPELADLALTKSVSTTTPNVGGNITYNLSLRNTGPSTATNITVSEPLTNGLTFVSATSSQGSYNNGTGTWTIPSVTSGSTATLQIVATVGNVSSITNVAQVMTVDQPDPDSTPGGGPTTEDDYATLTLTPQSADLSLSQTVDKTTPNVGESVMFTLRLTNSGPSTATGVNVRDALPTGVTYTSSIASAGSYSPTTGIWNVGSIASGVTASLQLFGNVTGGGTLQNVAEVSASQQFDPDSTPANGVTSEDDYATTSITPQTADLSLSKSVNNPSPNLSDEVTFTLTLSNQGPSAAGNVAVRDQLPAGLQFVRSNASQGSYSSASGIWTVGTIAAASNASLQITATVTSASGITNVAEVSASNQFDPDSTPSNGSQQEDDYSSIVLSPQQADLSLTQTVDNAAPNVNSEVTFTLTVSNGGPDSATNVAVKDQLPAGLNYVRSAPVQGSYNSGTGIWTVGVIPSGGTATLQLVAKPTQTGTLTNVTEISQSDQFDPDSTPDNGNLGEDDLASISLSGQSADLSLMKSVSNERPDVGESITFTVTVLNSGPATATGVTVADKLPSGLTIVNSATNAGSYNSGSGQWDIGTMVSGASSTLTITATVDDAGVKTNKAEIVASDLFDPDSTPNNNSETEDDQQTITLTPQKADLSLTKTVDETSPNVGQNITFTITVNNGGPDGADNVTVHDQLVDGLSFVSSSPSQGTYDSNTGIWTVGSVPATGSAQLTIIANVVNRTDKTNMAEIITSDQYDPDSIPGNNVPTEDDQDDANVSPQVADLELTTIVDDDKPNVGQDVTFTITVANVGPSAASNVQVRDQLPAGLTIVSTKADQGVYDRSTGTWSLGSVPRDGRTSLRITATVDQPTAGTHVAEIIASDQFDPDSTPNNNDSQEDDQTSTSLTPQTSDLSLVSAISTASPNVGELVTYSFDMNNAGPDEATNVRVGQILPAGITFVSADPSNGAYNVSSNEWILPTVSTGGTHTLEVVARVADATPLTSESEIVASDQYDPNSTPNNNQPAEDDQSNVSVTPQKIDLRMVQETSNASPNVDEEVVFTFGVVNGGPDTATGVEVTNWLPDGLTFVSATPSRGTYNSGTGIWTVGALATDVGASLEVVTKVNRLGEIFHVAEVTAADQFDVDSTPNNRDENEDDIVVATVQPQQVDLSLDKTVNNVRPNVGDNITFTLNLNNAGPDTATGITVADKLPAGLTFVSSDPSQGSYSSTAGIWTVGDVVNGGTATLTIVVTVSGPEATVNLAEVTAADQVDSDSTPNNNELTEDDISGAQVKPQVADLSITKTSSPQPVIAGEQLTYTLTVTNHGTSDATNVRMRDTLPPEVTFVSVATTQGTAELIDGDIQAALGTIPSGATATTTVIVTVVPGTSGILDNAATVTADQYDPDETNNTVTLESIAKLPPATISGTVYLDMDDNQLQDSVDPPIGGVQLMLQGEDVDGNRVFRQFITGLDGKYVFTDLPPGTYQVIEAQPMWFTQGQWTAGQGGKLVNVDQSGRDNFFLELATGETAENYHFTELFPYLSRGRVLASSSPNYP